ncbi:hypothetical protein HELRODRAFT_180512 [Helobdella robusta]|uniref:Leucine-rich repeat-containing protein 27 n=1 Tax=Helobdella robusta TaxID=6412 RepID=T1FG01_HELRO|nr:hypothetical protein HELRODRAFT_180512 [Helobdella robusta]ESN93860.1 hypothetical protein HELRODRAFT_180512 [Helobdella robusta]
MSKDCEDELNLNLSNNNSLQRKHVTNDNELRMIKDINNKGDEDYCQDDEDGDSDHNLEQDDVKSDLVLADCSFSDQKFINLSYKKLKEMPDSLLKLRDLERLNLEANEIRQLPDNLFNCLPSLKWLDLRNNKLEGLPNLGLDNPDLKLEVLLLESNIITRLPTELALAPKLTGLNVRRNPITYPPDDVIKMGLKYIRSFLMKSLDNDCCNNSNSSNNYNYNNANNNNNNADQIDFNIYRQSSGISSEKSNKHANSFSLYNKLVKKPEKQKKQLTTQSERYLSNMYGQPISENIVEDKFKEEARQSKQRNKLNKVNSILQARKLNHESFLKGKVAEQIQSIKNRQYASMDPKRAMSTANRDLDIALKLKDEIQKRKREIEFGNCTLPNGLNDI